MKKNLLLYSIVWIVLLIGCGPELQTVINRDAHNRVILEAEVKGEVDTLWSKVYTYHFAGDPALAVNTDPEPQETPEEETPEEPKVYIVTADTTKKSFSSYAKGKAEGEWKTWWPNGIIKSEFTYVKNEIEGVYSYFDSLGTKIKTETYKKSILNGVLSEYNENGTLRSTTDYVKGKKTGLVKEFLEGIVLLEQKTLKKDSLDGEWTSWHDNGTKKVVRVYKNGTPVGNWIFNDEKGEWMREEQYKGGLAHGIWSFYDEARDKVFQYYTKGKLMAEYTEAKWPNGQIKEVPSFKNGLPHGTWTGYWPDGSTRYKLDYKEGEKDGDEMRYDSLGVLIYEVRYAKGIRDGVEKEFYSNGNPKKEVRYAKGIRDGVEKEFYSNGNPKKEVRYAKGIRDGVEKEFYSNGNPKRTARYSNNLLDGKTELFDSLGVITETITYKDSLRNGKTTIWWPNGKAYQRLTYLNNVLEGEYEEWDSLGKDIVKGDYVNGTRDKKWLYYDSEGRRDKFIFLDMDSIITDYKFRYYPNWQIVEEPSFSDEGLYDGKWESFYLDGTKKKDYEYDMGKKDKIWMSYYQDKRRQNFTFYNQDSLVTDYDFKYYDNLQIAEEPEFNKEGLFDGKWEAFYEDGETKKTFGYDAGKKDKIWMSYYQDKRRQNFTFYNQDSLVTDYDFKYYDNLQIAEEPEFNKEGLFDGKWEAFYEDGETKKTFGYDAGKKDKIWMSYYQDKRRQNFTFYNQDSLVTDYDFKYYDNISSIEDSNYYNYDFYMNLKVDNAPTFENMQIVEEPSFDKNGLYDGKWEAFFEDGEIWRTFHYTEGKKDKLWTVLYDSTGVKQSETNFADDLREGMYFEWYESIKVRQKEEGLWVQDKKHEIWTYWNEFQEKTLEVWDMGNLLHTYKYEYYENGQVKEEPSYKDGKMHGDWVRYFPNGDIKGTRVFREGLREGLWVEYHRNPPGERDDIFAWKGKYVEDKKEGRWEWYWLNTNLQRVEVFKNDQILSQDCYERDGSGRKRECMEVRGPSSY